MNSDPRDNLVGRLTFAIMLGASLVIALGTGNGRERAGHRLSRVPPSPEQPAPAPIVSKVSTL